MIDHDALSKAPRLWPWQEQPYKVWSLLEMMRLLPENLIGTIVQLESGAARLWAEQSSHPEARRVSDKLVTELRASLGKVLPWLKDLVLSPSFELQLRKLEEGIESKTKPQELAEDVYRLVECLYAELKQWIFFAVRPEQRHFYEAPQCVVGEETFRIFTDSVDDLEAACRLYAFDEWTACVFHLMRAVGFALAKWGVDLGLSLTVPLVEAEWQTILSAAEAEQKRLQQVPKPQRSQTWQAEVELIGERLVYFHGFKNAWRNFVSHRHVSYDERKAEDVLDAVSSFFRSLLVKP